MATLGDVSVNLVCPPGAIGRQGRCTTVRSLCETCGVICERIRARHRGGDDPIGMRRRPSPGLRRRLGAAALSLATLAAVASPVVGASPASAAPSGSTVCSFPSGDSRFTGVTGMVATSHGYDIVNDTDSSGLSIYTLNPSTCKIEGTPTTSYNATPTDSQDLGETPDGSRWIADTGNLNSDRSTVALFKFPKGSDEATEYDLSYPNDATDVNAKALLMGRNGTPTIVSYGSPTRVYQPVGALDDQNTNSLELVGTIKLGYTGTPGGQLAQAGQKVVTGGAVSPNGKQVVLRTYTDAYEWDVKGGNIAKTITSGKPRRTPLPKEPNGEAISFSADGSSYLTVSDSSTSETDAKVLKYAPTAVGAASTAPNSTGSAGFQLTESDIIGLLVVVGVLGLGLVALGVVGIRRSRRRHVPDQRHASDARRGPPPGTGPRRSRSAGRPPEAETVVLPKVVDGAHPSRSEPPSSRRHRYREDPLDLANADTAAIERVVDRPGTRDGYQPPPFGGPPAGSPSGQELPRRRRERHTIPYGDDPAGPPQGGDTYRSSTTYRAGPPEPPAEHYPPPVDPYERRAAPSAAPPPTGYEPPRHDVRPPAAQPPPEEIDWLEDMRDAGPPPFRRDPPPPEQSTQIRRRLR